jgi:hypothetical protein
VVTTVVTFVNERPSALAAACPSFAAAALPPTAHFYGVGIWAVDLALVESIYKGRIGSVSPVSWVDATVRTITAPLTSTTSSINGTTSAKGAVMGQSQRSDEARGVPPRGRPV